MFQLAIIKDTMSIHPSDFGIAPEVALKHELNKKYANRILHDVGLCICVFDISQASEGKVRYGDGFLWYKVVFRMVIFRPFTSEVILATVRSTDEDGIRLHTDFFDDIHVPAMYLPQPCAFDPNERAFFWLPDSELTSVQDLLDTPTSDRWYIDRDQQVRVRVEADEFYENEPGPMKIVDGILQQGAVKRPPYTLICSMAEQGLGPVSWWNGSGEQEEDADAMEEG